MLTKQRRNVTLELLKRHTKLLWAVKEELCKDTVCCEHFIQLLSMLAAKEKNLLKLELSKEVEEEKPCKRWIIITLFYLWNAGAVMIDREQATAIEQSSHLLSDVSTHSSRLTLRVNRCDEPSPPVAINIRLWSIHCHRSFKDQKKLSGSALEITLKRNWKRILRYGQLMQSLIPKFLRSTGRNHLDTDTTDCTQKWSKLPPSSRLSRWHLR